MNLSKLSLAMIVALPLVAQANTLERSSQSVAPFFEEGNYAELSYTWVNPEIPGTEAGSTTQNIDGNSAKQYGMTGAALKFEPIDGVAAAIIYDEPFGLDYKYLRGSSFEGMTATVNSQNVTTLVGNQFVPNLWLYGGLAFQDIDAAVAIPQARYTFNVQDNSVGYVAGAAFEKPEIALRAALTYRSKIEHKTTAKERGAVSDRMTFDTPQSVNLEFQTGISPTTLLMADIRWANWSDFEVAPTLYTKNFGEPLVEYDDDLISGGIGIGHQFTDKLSGLARIQYETGAGTDSLSIFGPYDDTTTFILGGKYNFSKQVEGTLGVAYSILGDADYKVGDNTVAKFEDGEAISVGGKLGYHF